MSLKDKKSKEKEFIKSFRAIKEKTPSPELLFKFSYTEYRQQLDCKMLRTAPFAFVQHIPSFLMPPSAEPL